MSNHRRVWVPGGTYFFTVNQLERRCCLEVGRGRPSTRRRQLRAVRQTPSRHQNTDSHGLRERFFSHSRASRCREISNAPSKRASLLTQRSNVPPERASLLTQRSNVPSKRVSLLTQRSNVPSKRASLLTLRSSVPPKRSSLLTLTVSRGRKTSSVSPNRCACQGNRECLRTQTRARQ